MNNNMNNNGFCQGGRQSSQQYGNINQAFSNPKSIIDRPDFTNKGYMLHNNMGDSLRDQRITEYKIHIHSKDRNISSNPSPFSFKLPFGSTQSFKIDRKFNQVKYVSIDYVILPRNIAIDTSRCTDSTKILIPSGSNYISGGSETVANPMSKLAANKYLVLKIEEFSNSKNLGTSPEIENNTFILYHDKYMGIDGGLWKPLHQTIVYPTSQLFNITNMSVKLYDFMNNEIKVVDQNGNDIIKNNMSGTNKNYIKYISDNADLDSVAYTDNVTQMTIMMTIGVIENELTIIN